MNHFTTSFTVSAPVAVVSAFHQDTRILKRLSSLPLYVQIHEFGAMKEGMMAKFTMWFGLVPVYWEVVHSNVSENGFTDTQQVGPLKSWQHSHRFVAEGDNMTRVHESIRYEYPSGWRGWLTRLVFGRPGLHTLFLYRQWVTRRGVARLLKQKP